VSKFVLGLGSARVTSTPTEANDVAMLARLRRLVEETTAAFEAFDYARAIERTETFFWWFCDEYVELVKGRAYGAPGFSADATASANAALQQALHTLLRLFAPFLAYATEEVWSWWQEGSVHRSAWPAASEFPTSGDAAVLDPVCAVLSAIRKAKTEQKLSMRAPVEHVVVQGPKTLVAAIESAQLDLREAGCVSRFDIVEGGDELKVDVTLSPVG
jgi:valyl-tRNA synthetase